MINVAGIDWSKVTKAGEIAPPKFAPKGVTTFMQPPKQSVNLKKFIPQVAPKEEYISPYMELNKPISPEQKQVVMALGANIKKGDDLATIRQKFPEIADIGDKSLQALRANIMKGDSPEMIEKKFPELQWIKTKQTDDKYKYNIMNKPTQFLQGLREKAENIDIPVVEPLAKGVLGTAMLGTKGMRDVIQGGAGLLDKGIAGATGTDKVYKSGVAEDVFDVAQGSSNTLASVVAPVSVTALGTVMSALPKPVQQSVGDIFQNIGGFIAKTPGLKQWKESLPPERRAEFDNEVMGGLTALFLGAKNKLNLLKNPKAFVQENILNPQNVVKNIEQNVLNVPGRIKNIPTGARNTADWVISTELPRGKWRDKFYKMTGKTPEKYIGDMGVKGLDAEGLAKLEESRDFAKGQADEGLSEIKGNYRYRPIEYTKSDGTKVEYVGDAIRDMLEDIIDKKPKNTTEVDKYREYLRKYDDEGLSQTEINTAKREFERSNRFNYLRENNIDRYNRATNVDSAVREWQYKVAESRGLDLKSVNKQTQAIKTLIDKLGGDAPEMKGFNLSDWLIAGNMTPEAIALLVGKKIADSKYIKNKIVSALNIGRKTGLKKINKSALEASQRKVDIERYLYDKFGKNDVPSSDIYGLPVRSNNRLGLPRQVESPTNVYKPRTDVVTPTGKVIPSKFKKVIEMGEATQPGTTKLDTQVVKLEGQENMPKTLPNTGLPKKMPKSLKTQEKQAVIEGEKGNIEYKNNIIEEKNGVVGVYTKKGGYKGTFKSIEDAKAFLDNPPSILDPLKKLARESKDISEFTEKATKLVGENKMIDNEVERLALLKQKTNKDYDYVQALSDIYHKEKKVGLPIKETPVPKQVPEAKNIEEDLLAEARKYKSAEEFINGLRSKYIKEADALTAKQKVNNPDDAQGTKKAQEEFYKKNGISKKDLEIYEDTKVADIEGMEKDLKTYKERGKTTLAKQQEVNIERAKESNEIHERVSKIEDARFDYREKNAEDIMIKANPRMTESDIATLKKIRNVPTIPKLKQIREQANKKGLPVKEAQPTKQVVSSGKTTYKNYTLEGKNGNILVYTDKGGYRGTFKSLEEAKAFIDRFSR